MRSSPITLQRKIGGRTFEATVRGQPCPQCGTDGVGASVRARFHLRVALELTHVPESTTVRFMRDALGLGADELARLLAVSTGTLSRWENGRRPVPRAAFAVLSILVRDALDGRSDILAMLRAFVRGPSRVVQRPLVVRAMRVTRS